MEPASKPAGKNTQNSKSLKTETPIQAYRRQSKQSENLLNKLNPGDVCTRCGKTEWSEHKTNGYNIAVRKCDSCANEWHVCPTKEHVIITDFPGEALRCEFCADKSIIDQIREAQNQIGKLKPQLKPGDMCASCDSFDWEERVLAGYTIRVCLQCSHEWHLCPMGGIVEQTSQKVHLRCSYCLGHEPEVISSCPICKSTTSTNNCGCGLDCNHFHCGSCFGYWHECPHGVNQTIMCMTRPERYHMFCHRCYNDPWMAPQRIFTQRPPEPSATK